MEVGRYAPSTTGPAHPGTLLAALLCWLDARSRGARIALRLEDLDPHRCRPEYARAMQDDLAWIGLDWQAVRLQSELASDHEDAIERLKAAGLVYPCCCSRSEVAAVGLLAAGGGYHYPNTCRGRSPEDAGPEDALRCRIEDDAEFGDPIVVRRDGGVAYHLASVVDAAREGVTRVVRGRDLETTTATQIALQRLLGFATPEYHHHLLLLEPRGEKLAKLHGSVSATELRQVYQGPALCGVLAHAAGLLDEPRDVRPDELLMDFSWDRVRVQDRVMEWDGAALRLRE
ncbi:MAG: glutamate--tRNA ligase family protein [Myxococcota bacterium]|nr:glutamate--tRNA ligase family protein [Myxococcota bacterium]